MKSILITGGAGFIGCAIAHKLAENKHNKIAVADNLARGRMDDYFKSLIKKDNVKFINVDLTKLSQVKGKIWTTYDQIYHLAAILGVKHCMNNPEKVLEVNVKSTMNIIELAKRNRCGKILFTSSSETYASGFQLGIVKIPTDEKVPLSISDVFNARLSYASSKVVGEQMIIFNSKKNFNFSIVRYHNIFGPRMGYSHVIPEIIKRIVSKENPFKVYGYDQTRAFCFIEDAVRGTISVMDSKKTNGEIVHLGNKAGEIRIVDLVKKIFKISGYNAELDPTIAFQGSVNRRCPETSKIERLTGFHPKVKLDDGLNITVRWYMNDMKNSGVWE
jgi:UDP-glucose 4-epimerase